MSFIELLFMSPYREFRKSSADTGTPACSAALPDVSGALARGTGFLARFLVAWPESTQGHRPYSDPLRQQSPTRCHGLAASVDLMPY